MANNGWLPCRAPRCSKRVRIHYFCCPQHRALLGFELNVRLHTGWLQRSWDPNGFEQVRAESMKVWAEQMKEIRCQP